MTQPARERLVLLLNDHVFSILTGICFGKWLSLLRDNDFAIEGPFLPRAAVITVASLHNSLQSLKEARLYIRHVESIAVAPPVFILGHWRSGTTFLHNLLAADEQFAYPNIYQVFFPDTFLTTEAIGARVLKRFLPTHRYQDNVPLTISAPQEDEYALCMSSLCSQYLSWVFPRALERYDRYLTLRNVPEADVLRWKQAFITFAKKLTWKYRRTLLLKSPTHTCRIRLLLELFPNARFVHIHRHPYDVFASNRNSYERAGAPYYLQHPDPTLIEDLIVSRYRTMFDAFFDERHLIPAGCFHEVAFEDLRRDPLGEIRRVYEGLGLDGFGTAQDALRTYIVTQRDYQMNRYPPLPTRLRRRLSREWQQSFERWGYRDVNPADV